MTQRRCFHPYSLARNMTLDDRIAKERKAVAFHQKAAQRGRMPARKLVRHGRERRAALAILAVLEKVKQLPGM